MAYQNPKQYGWCPPNNYQIHEVTGPALRKRVDRPRHEKRHVEFKINNEEPKQVVEAPTPPVPEKKATVNANETVDQKADSFIKLERNRIELARLKSMGARGS